MDKYKEYDKLMEEQERLKNRQAELELMRNRQLEKLRKQQLFDPKPQPPPPKLYDSDNFIKNNNGNSYRQIGNFNLLNYNDHGSVKVNENKKSVNFLLDDVVKPYNGNSSRHNNNNDQIDNYDDDLDKFSKNYNAYDTNSNRDQPKKIDSYSNQNIRKKSETEILNDSAVVIQSAYRGYKDRQKVKDLRKKRLLTIDDVSENGSVNNDQNEFDPNSQEALREKLRKTKEKRSELENLRDELIKHLKTIHNRITVRRKEARDLWKKKYFAEKKKTPELEEKVTSLLNEIEGLQKKMFTSLESDIKNAANHGYPRESDVKNGWLTSLKLEEEIFLLKRQVDQSKLKLTTDIKLRNQAETESRALKTELAQTKANLIQLKNNL